MISCQSLETIIAGTKLTSLKEMRQEQDEIPGGRHNNDFIDFRKFKFYQQRKNLFVKLLIFTKNELPPPVIRAAKMYSCITGQFRLLREDMLGPAKECSIDDPRKQRRDV